MRIAERIEPELNLLRPSDSRVRGVRNALPIDVHLDIAAISHDAHLNRSAFVEAEAMAGNDGVTIRTAYSALIYRSNRYVERIFIIENRMS